MLRRSIYMLVFSLIVWGGLPALAQQDTTTYTTPDGSFSLEILFDGWDIRTLDDGLVVFGRHGDLVSNYLATGTAQLDHSQSIFFARKVSPETLKEHGSEEALLHAMIEETFHDADELRIWELEPFFSRRGLNLFRIQGEVVGGSIRTLDGSGNALAGFRFSALGIPLEDGSYGTLVGVQRTSAARLGASFSLAAVNSFSSAGSPFPSSDDLRSRALDVPLIEAPIHVDAQAIIDDTALAESTVTSGIGTPKYTIAYPADWQIDEYPLRDEIYAGTNLAALGDVRRRAPMQADDIGVAFDYITYDSARENISPTLEMHAVIDAMVLQFLTYDPTSDADTLYLGELADGRQIAYAPIRSGENSGLIVAVESDVAYIYTETLSGAADISDELLETVIAMTANAALENITYADVVDFPYSNNAISGGFGQVIVFNYRYPENWRISQLGREIPIGGAALEFTIPLDSGFEVGLINAIIIAVHASSPADALTSFDTLTLGTAQLEDTPTTFLLGGREAASAFGEMLVGSRESLLVSVSLGDGRYAIMIAAADTDAIPMEPFEEHILAIAEQITAGEGPVVQPQRQQQDSDSGAVDIQFGETVIATLRGPGDEWRFSGQRGDIVTITMESSWFDTYLELIDPNGELVASNDDVTSFFDTDSEIAQLILFEDGIYTIIAGGYDSDARGEYQLTLSGSGN